MMNSQPNGCLHSSNQFKDLSLATSNNPPVFARHETFHPRYGWLKKGFDKVSLDSDLFSKDSAPVVLGIGKNMAKAVRYWCLAFKLLDEVQKPGQRVRSFVPTQFGTNLLGSNGWDPYLENTASLWLLHWNLLKSPCYATAWHYVFNFFNHATFTHDDLLQSLCEFKEMAFSSNKATESSLNKDINCLLRMYVASNNQKVFREDSLDCPFSELGIIKANEDAKHFAFNIGHKYNLPSEIIVAACLEYASLIENNAMTISVSRLLHDEGSPGQAFKLTEGALSQAIESESMKNKNLSLTDTAGLVLLSYASDPGQLAESILNDYYRSEG